MIAYISYARDKQTTQILYLVLVAYTVSIIGIKPYMKELQKCGSFVLLKTSY